MSLPARVTPADPYDHTDERNKLAVHTPQPRALALKDKIGAFLLDNQSDFVAIARAAGVPASPWSSSSSRWSARSPRSGTAPRSRS